MLVFDNVPRLLYGLKVVFYICFYHVCTRAIVTFGDLVQAMSGLCRDLVVGSFSMQA